MSKTCGTKCYETASLDSKNGSKLMIAGPGNTKYSPGELHPQCPACLNEIIEHGRLMILFNNDEVLVNQYEEMMSKKPRK
jgi:hypothetical protein